MIRSVWNISNTGHRYLIEELSGTKHISTKLYQRYLNFINSLRNSKKKCLASLAEMAISDQASTTRRNLNLISTKSGCSNVLEMDTKYVGNSIIYEKIPEDEIWKVEFLREAMSIRSGELELDNFSAKEVQTMIYCISSM